MDRTTHRWHYSLGRMAAAALLVALMCVGVGAAPQALAEICVWTDCGISAVVFITGSLDSRSQPAETAAVVLLPCRAS